MPLTPNSDFQTRSPNTAPYKEKEAAEKAKDEPKAPEDPAYGSVAIIQDLGCRIEGVGVGLLYCLNFLEKIVIAIV